MTFFGYATGWIRSEIHKANRQRRAAHAIEGVGGKVGYDFQCPSGAANAAALASWNSIARCVLGDDYLTNVVSVNFCPMYIWHAKVSDPDLANLAAFPQLRKLSLSHTAITDGGLAYLRGLAELQELTLFDVAVTDAGLAHIEGLSKLRDLDLAATDITDAGLVQLAGLSHLETLSLHNTAITGAGLGHLRGLGRLRELQVDNEQLTEVALANLEKSVHARPALRER